MYAHYSCHRSSSLVTAVFFGHSSFTKTVGHDKGGHESFSQGVAQRFADGYSIILEQTGVLEKVYTYQPIKMRHNNLKHSEARHYGDIPE